MVLEVQQGPVAVMESSELLFRFCNGFPYDGTQ